MAAIEADTKEIVGHWVVVDGHVRIDHNAERVAALTEGYLRQVAYDPVSGAWNTLFLDPETGDYWERVYLQGELHGGGPPSLIRIDAIAARRKYGLT